MPQLPYWSVVTSVWKKLKNCHTGELTRLFLFIFSPPPALFLSLHAPLLLSVTWPCCSRTTHLAVGGPLGASTDTMDV